MRTPNNIQPGTWYTSNDYKPVAGVRVLCTNQNKEMWFDTISKVSGNWCSQFSCGNFAWQVVALPIDMYWEL